MLQQSPETQGQTGGKLGEGEEQAKIIISSLWGLQRKSSLPANIPADMMTHRSRLPVVLHETGYDPAHQRDQRIVAIVYFD